MLSRILGLFFVFSLCFQVNAEEKASNSDLRNKKEVFSITEFTKDKQRVYKLVTSGLGEFNIILASNKVVQSLKIDSEDAQNIDEQFADKYISLQFMMEQNKEKKCANLYKLVLRGEKQNICLHEKEKINLVNSFITFLESKFHK